MRVSSSLTSLAAIVGVILASVLALASAEKQSTATAYLDQGWDAATRVRFYHESQGTRFIPAAMLQALQDPSGAAFLSPQNMRRFGFIVDENGDGQSQTRWPVGFALDRDAKTGVTWVGFSCAACHTAQLQYQGHTFRVDGGPAAIDVAEFRRAMAMAVIATGKDPARRTAFEQRAVALGFPAAGIAAAFDRMYQTTLHSAQMPPDYVVASTPGGPGRLDALSAIGTAIFSTDLGVPANAKKGSAPVDFPYLWDIWRFDWVQYNASVRQPMDRNVGEALGVGIQTNMIDPATGNVMPEAVRWKSTVKIEGLYWMENALIQLRPPAWPQAILGPLDAARVARGRELFVANCAACHGVQQIAGTNPTEWNLPVIPLSKVGTDPNEAADYARNTYDATKLGLGAHVRTPDGLAYVVVHVKEQAYEDAALAKDQWPKYDGFGRVSDAFPAPCGYRARPLIGVWATGPFLHNGSVPTVYDLLSDSRPLKFWFGSRELDPVKLGFAQAQGPGTMLFDASLPGNSNAGHWFTNDRSRAGRIGPALTDAQKFAIIEFLKAATESNYPARTVAAPSSLPCSGTPAWADNL